MEWIHQHLDLWLGLRAEPRDFTFLQLALRAIVVFAASLLMLRLAHKRFFAGKNAVDVLLSFILASTLSRAINGSGSFFGTIAVGFFIVILHNVLTWAACRFHRFGGWLKGHPQAIVREGQIDKNLMKKHHVSQSDLDEDLRLNGGLNAVEKVREAMLERSGEISVQRKPQVFTIKVADGVQTIRLEVEG